jgi:hypothetical protein
MVHGVGEKNAQPTWLVSSLVRLVQCGFREQFRRSSSRLPSPPCAPFFERQPSRKIRLGMAWEARFVAGGVGDLVAVQANNARSTNLIQLRRAQALTSPPAECMGPCRLIVGDSQQNGSVSRSRMAKPAGEDDHRCGRLHVGPTRRRRRRDVGHAAFLREVARAPAGMWASKRLMQRSKLAGYAA